MTEIPTEIIFLGNPGQEYAQTRHNAGFLVGERLAELLDGQSEVTVSPAYSERDVKSRTVEVADRLYRLLWPQLYMNRSGQALANFFRYLPNSLQPTDLLIVRDEIDLPVGSFRVQQSNGSGGHHGVESIQAVLGQDEPLWQLKIGISRDDRMPVDTYVLKPPLPDEQRLLTEVIDKTANFILDAIILQTKPLEPLTERVI